MKWVIGRLIIKYDGWLTINLRNKCSTLFLFSQPQMGILRTQIETRQQLIPAQMDLNT